MPLDFLQIKILYASLTLDERCSTLKKSLMENEILLQVAIFARLLNAGMGAIIFITCLPLSLIFTVNHKKNKLVKTG